MSVTKKDISDHIYQLIISAYDSTAQDLAARIHQQWPLFEQKLELYDAALIRRNY